MLIHSRLDNSSRYFSPSFLFMVFAMQMSPVACSTVTVTKCLAALKTLQAFPFFRPTCLCKEPGLDPECNNFQDFLFDHPCGLVRKKGNAELYNVRLVSFLFSFIVVLCVLLWVNMNTHKMSTALFTEKDPYPSDALPTCNHALAICQQSPKCIELFESFKTHCKVRDNKCRMEDKYGFKYHFLIIKHCLSLWFIPFFSLSLYLSLVCSPCPFT